jgi:hypothetical protein
MPDLMLTGAGLAVCTAGCTGGAVFVACIILVLPTEKQAWGKTNSERDLLSDWTCTGLSRRVWFPDSTGVLKATGCPLQGCSETFKQW